MTIDFIRTDDKGQLSQEDFRPIAKALGRGGARRAQKLLPVRDVNVYVKARYDLHYHGIPVVGETLSSNDICLKVIIRNDVHITTLSHAQKIANLYPPNSGKSIDPPFISASIHL